MEQSKQITVTEPLLPPLEEFIPYLEKIWESKWITNNGAFHKELERALCDYLGVEYISLFTNGTLPLITALQALDIRGEVITTPFSFVATTHSIWWNGLRPVFVDVDEKTGEDVAQGLGEDLVEELLRLDGLVAGRHIPAHIGIKGLGLFSK